MATTEFHPDARLIALGAEFDRRHAEWLAASIKAQPVFDAYYTRFEELYASGLLKKDDWKTIGYEMGYRAKVEKINTLCANVDDVTKKIREIPAETMVGFALKVKAAASDCNFSADFDEPEDDMDWDVLCFLNLMREAERLARLSA